MARLGEENCAPRPLEQMRVEGDGKGLEPLNVPAVGSQTVRTLCLVTLTPMTRAATSTGSCNFEGREDATSTIRRYFGSLTEAASPR